jgi:hypothetical protein
VPPNTWSLPRFRNIYPHIKIHLANLRVSQERN